ncbi:MAG: sialidase family protein, partial [Planctomycetota bacterium]
AFDALEANVRKNKPGELGLAVALEDRVISPPVVHRFRLLKENQWHTLRVPIKPLGEMMNLKDVVNFWIIVDVSPDDVEVRLDDLRLVRGEGAGKLPVLKDASPVKESYGKLAAELVEIIPTEAKHNVRNVKGEVQPAAPKPGDDPRKFTRPAKVEAFGLFEKPGGYTRRVYPYGLELLDDSSAVIRYPTASLASTSDAGKTWTKLRGGFSGTNSWRSEVSGDRGDLLYVGLGQCSGGGTPSSFYFRRLVPSAGSWKWGPAYPVDRDTRHCQDHYDVLRLDSGRIWAAWNHCQRFGGYGMHAKYSDDDGRTWKAPEAGPALTGSVGKGSLKSDPKLLPVGGGLACLWQDNSRRVYFNRFDGESWSAAAQLKASGLTSAASPDGKTVFVVTGGGRNGPVRVLKGDGKSWTEDLKPPAPGYLTVQRKSGRLHYVCAENADGKTRALMISRAGGKWSAPREVFKPGEKHAGCELATVSLARWSPEEFVPVAVVGLRGKKSWKDVVWIQVLKVPADNP